MGFTPRMVIPLKELLNIIAPPPTYIGYKVYYRASTTPTIHNKRRMAK